MTVKSTHTYVCDQCETTIDRAASYLVFAMGQHFCIPCFKDMSALDLLVCFETQYNAHVKCPDGRIRNVSEMAALGESAQGANDSLYEHARSRAAGVDTDRHGGTVR